MRYQRQSSFLDERGALLSPTPDPPVTLKYDRGEAFEIDNDMIDILILFGKKTNKQFELISVDPNSNNFKINGVDVSLLADGKKIKSKIYDFSTGFAMFFTRKDITERDVRGVERKVEQILRDINYKQRGDTKNNRSKLIKKFLASMNPLQRLHHK